MKDYVICVDASIDIAQDYIKDNGIVIIPMEYMIGSEEKIMENRLSEEELVSFYDEMRAGKETHTSQITPYYYQQIFRREAQTGRDILYISLSGGLSSTYSSALTAAEEIEDEFEGLKIEVVDSRAGTGGMGLLLMAAVRAKESGVSLSRSEARYTAEDAVQFDIPGFQAEALHFVLARPDETLVELAVEAPAPAQHPAAPAPALSAPAAPIAEAEMAALAARSV